MDILQKIKGKVLVSCQSHKGEPLYGAEYMAKMAQTVVLGGAGGIRANGVADIKSICSVVKVPVIGICKVNDPKTEVVITPTFSAAKEIIEAGASIVALDATKRPRRDGSYGTDLIKKIKDEFDVLIMADISTLDEGIHAAKAGADIVATTLSGYTKYSKKIDGPNIELIRGLKENVDKPIIAEGRIRNPTDAVKAFEAGAWAVVVGTAITMPNKITENFVSEVNKFIKGS